MKSDINRKDLYKAILSLRNGVEAEKFFRDLLTSAEIDEFSNRWKVAKMLQNKESYDLINQETGMSTTTIARISKWLNNGMGGYKLIIDRLNKKENKFTK